MPLNFGSMLGSQGRGDFNLTYRGVSIVNTTLATHTSGSFSIGNADAERWVICCIYGYDYTPGAAYLSTSTICGVTVGSNYVESKSVDSSGLYYYRCIIAWAKVPTGTTGTVVSKFATTMDGLTVHTFTCIGGQANYTKTGNAADSSSSVNANNITTTDGFLLATSFIGIASSSGNTTFSGNTGLSSTPRIENYWAIRSVYQTLLAIDWIETTPRSTLSLTAVTSATEDDPLVISTLSWGEVLPAAPSVTYTAGYVSGFTVTSFSQTLDIGPPADDRYVIVALMIDLSTTGVSSNTVTVGGAATTKVAAFGTDGDEDVAIYITNAPVTSGTTATIATGTITGGYQIAAAVYAAYGINPTYHDRLIAAEGTDPSGTIDIPAGGFAIAASISGSSGASLSWVGATSVSSNSSAARFETGKYDNSGGSALTGHTITADFSGGQTDDKLVAVSWGR